MGKKKRRRKKHSSGLTEKPLFEGVLTKNQNKYAIEFRKGDGELQTVVKDAQANPDRLIYKIPFVRGIFVLVNNLLFAVESLEFTAEAFGNDTTKETVIDRILRKIFGKHINMIVTAGTACVSFVICFFFVTFFPYLLSEYLERYIINKSVLHIIEFAASILIMVLYLSAFLLFKDVRRMLKYHGAAHKCINCIERGRKLTYKNVASSSRFFPRCTTNYIAFCVFISIILFIFVRIDSVPLRLLFRLIYIPLATGLFYELYVLISSLPDCIFLKILTAPGMLFQVFSTLRPDDEMIATAMASLDAAFDWREFLVINFPDKFSSSDFGLDKKDPKEAVDALLAEQQLEKEIEEEYARVDEELLQSEYSEETDNYYMDENGEFITVNGDEEYEEYYVNQDGEYVYVQQGEEEYYVDEDGQYYVNYSEEEEPEEYVEETVEYAEEPAEEIIEEEPEEEYAEEAEEYSEEEIYDNIEEENVPVFVTKASDMEKTQPVSIDFMDDYGFDPEDEEVDENTMQFEPVDESVLAEKEEEYEEGNVPLFSKEIESIPMPDSLDNIKEVLPQGGVKARVYINTEEEEKNEFDEDDENIDFDNIIDENGHLTLKDTDAFNRMLDDEYDEIFKRLGLDSDDL
ncbi:MAG: DUF1385 domain-containing protein [Lachnospiraceae bacterium]|nr:DUF1385 domain-containing protein [Lachnospiraceae bacterium]